MRALSLHILFPCLWALHSVLKPENAKWYAFVLMEENCIESEKVLENSMFRESVIRWLIRSCFWKEQRSHQEKSHGVPGEQAWEPSLLEGIRFSWHGPLCVCVGGDADTVSTSPGEAQAPLR